VEYLQGNLPASIRQTIDQTERRYLSIIAPWEIQMKQAVRDRIRPVDIAAAIAKMGPDHLAGSLWVSLIDCSSLRRDPMIWPSSPQTGFSHANPTNRPSLQD
jgi:hypothetical protein